MNALTHPRSGYGAEDSALRPLRKIEYDAFARVTRRMASAWAHRKADFPALALALNENLSLWRVLALDVADTGNPLPPTLRAQLFYLYEFVDHHTSRVLENAANVEVLADINKAVMKGLRGDGGAS